MVSHKSVKIKNVLINHIIHLENSYYVLHKIFRSIGSDIPLAVYESGKIYSSMIINSNRIEAG